MLIPFAMGGRRVDPWAGIPTSGLIAYYKFAEGTGTAVADEMSTYPIDLTTPTNPNVAWAAHGLTTTAGLIQTPSITGARTVVFMYETTRAESGGFYLSGGASSGSGWVGDQILIGAGTAAHIGSARGVSPVWHRTTNGTVSRRINRAGWKVAFAQFASAHNTILGLGGRHSTTTSRCASFKIAAALVYNKTLSDDERAAIYAAMRKVAVSRGFCIDWRDCATKADVYLNWGESNADGRTSHTELSAGQKAKSLSRNYVGKGTSPAITTYPPPLMICPNGSVGNTTNSSPSTAFGLPLLLAHSRQDDVVNTRDLYVAQNGEGSTYLAPSSISPAAPSTSWNAAELANSGNLSGLMEVCWEIEGYLLSNGIGPRLLGAVGQIGLNDAVQDATAPDVATYKGWGQALHDTLETYLGYPDLPHVIIPAHSHDPSSDVTALAVVQQALEELGDDNSSITILSGDDYTIGGDNVHFDLTGLTEQQADVYAALNMGAL